MFSKAGAFDVKATLAVMLKEMARTNGSEIDGGWPTIH